MTPETMQAREAFVHCFGDAFCSLIEAATGQGRTNLMEALQEILSMTRDAARAKMIPATTYSAFHTSCIKWVLRMAVETGEIDNARADELLAQSTSLVTEFVEVVEGPMI